MKMATKRVVVYGSVVVHGDDDDLKMRKMKKNKIWGFDLMMMMMQGR
jgi:hypothetical protein